jgi:putative phage-type endonuclease
MALNMPLELDPVVHPDAWLEARRKGIGSSDAAVVLGLSPYRTPLALWAEKRGLAPPQPETPAMRRGKLLEAHILDEAQELLGCELPSGARQVFLQHRDRPWQIATLDGLTVDGLVVEAKTVGWRSARFWGEPGTDEIPEPYLVQVQHQLAVAGRDEAAVVALIGGSDLHVYRIRRDDRLIDRMTAIEAAFWACVLDAVEPPVTDAADAEVLAYLHPPTDAAVELWGAVAAIADRYEECGRAAREAGQARDLARAELLAAMGDASRGTLPDGRTVSRKLVRREAYTVKASEYTTLTVKAPKGGAA